MLKVAFGWALGFMSASVTTLMRFDGRYDHLGKRGMKLVQRLLPGLGDFALSSGLELCKTLLMRECQCSHGSRTNSTPTGSVQSVILCDYKRPEKIVAARKQWQDLQ